MELNRRKNQYLSRFFFLLVMLSCTPKPSTDNASVIKEFKHATLLNTTKGIELSEIEYDFVRIGEKNPIKNEVFDFRESEVNVIFFGFAECHGTCPLVLTQFSEEMSSLTQQQKNDIRLVFVNLDIEASLEDVRNYLSSFDFRSVGVLPKAEKDLAKWKALFGAYSRPATAADNTPDKIVHSSQLFLVDDASQWRGYYSFPLAKGSLAEDFKTKM